MKGNRLLDIMIPALASLVIKLNALTLRLETEGEEHLRRFSEQSRPVLFAFWHNRLLYTCYYLRKQRLTMMISRSRDGERIARVARYFGIQSIRGSSSKNGRRAIVEMVRKLREGENGGITPDGPRGPRYRIQPGVLIVAGRAEVPILPVSISFSRMKIFQSWDRFRVPYPFSRAVLLFGEPFYVPKNLKGETFEEARRNLEAKLQEITEKSDRYFP